MIDLIQDLWVGNTEVNKLSSPRQFASNISIFFFLEMEFEALLPSLKLNEFTFVPK